MMSGSSSGVDPSALICVPSLPSVYGSASKAELRARTNQQLAFIQLSKAKFSKILHFQRTRISMVLHNSYQSDALIVYTRFSEWLYMQDCRFVYALIHAIESGLVDRKAVSTSGKSHSQSARAVGLVEYLASNKGSKDLDRVTTSLRQKLLQHFKGDSSHVSSPTTLKLYLSCRLDLNTRSLVDPATRAWLDAYTQSGKAPEGGYSFLAHLGVTLAAKGMGGHGGVEATGVSDDERTPAASAHQLRRSSSATASASGVGKKQSPPPPSQPRQRRRAATAVESEGDESEPDVLVARSQSSAIRGVKRKRASSAGAAANQAQLSSAPAHAPRRTTSSSASSRKRQYIPRDNGQQHGPFSPWSPDTDYTPAVYLNTSMEKIVRRVQQVLDRDGTSRRQVALAIHVSQSKISRLLHGRSPFRNASEEFHLRHWLYRQEKNFASQLSPILARNMGSSKVLDFASLPDPLNAISPPTNLVLYLHFMLPLDKRAPIDAMVEKALGLTAKEAMEEEDDEDEEDEEEDEEEEGGDEEEAARMKDEEDEARRQAEDEAAAASALAAAATGKFPSPSPSPSPDASPMPFDVSGDEGEGEEKSDNRDVDPRELTGLDAWFTAPLSAVRRRLTALMAITHTSQTDLSQLLESSSATVSLLLRGEFRFASLDYFMLKLRNWGRSSDQFIVSKVCAILGADHSTFGEPPVKRELKEESKEGAEPVPAELRIKSTKPIIPRKAHTTSARSYLEYLGLTNKQLSEALESERAKMEQMRRREQQKAPSMALRELVRMLANQGIPLDKPVAPPSSAHNLAPLSLWSWLNFECSFADRSRLDFMIVPWVERWSGSRANESAQLTLMKHQMAACARFQIYVQAEQKGKIITPHKGVKGDIEEDEEVEEDEDEEEEEKEAEQAVDTGKEEQKAANDADMDDMVGALQTPISTDASLTVKLEPLVQTESTAASMLPSPSPSTSLSPSPYPNSVYTPHSSPLELSSPSTSETPLPLPSASASASASVSAAPSVSPSPSDSPLPSASPLATPSPPAMPSNTERRAPRDMAVLISPFPSSSPTPNTTASISNYPTPGTDRHHMHAPSVQMAPSHPASESVPEPMAPPSSPPLLTPSPDPSPSPSSTSASPSASPMNMDVDPKLPQTNGME